MSRSSSRKHEEALPMMRFRTAYPAHVITRESCGCGRTPLKLKIAPITGQRDDMLIVKGGRFSPKRGQRCAGQCGGRAGHYVIHDAQRGIVLQSQSDVFPICGLPRQEVPK